MANKTIEAFDQVAARFHTSAAAPFPWPVSASLDVDHAVIERLTDAARRLPRDLPQPINIDALMPREG